MLLIVLYQEHLSLPSPILPLGEKFSPQSKSTVLELFTGYPVGNAKLQRSITEQKEVGA